jgi:hypothetical protein
MPLRYASASALLKGMENNGWIDLKTSAVFIDFVVVNPNVKVLSLVKLLFEFPPSSSIKASVSLQSARFDMLLPTEGGVTAAEIWLLIQVCFYLILELLKIAHLKSFYLKDAWVLVDGGLYIAYIVAFAYRLQPYTIVSSVGWPPRPDEFINYEGAFRSLGQFKNVIALCSVLAWLKSFKYLHLIPFLNFLLCATSRAIGQALAYGVIFLNCLWGFSLAHVLAFGADMGEFSTAGRAMLTLYRSMLGEGRLEGAWPFAQPLGPVLYFGWSIVGTLFLTVRTACSKRACSTRVLRTLRVDVRVC